MTLGNTRPNAPEQAVQHPDAPHVLTCEERRAAFAQAVREARDIGDIADAFEKYAKT